MSTSTQSEPLEIKMNTIPAALLLVVVGLVGAYVLSSVLVLALGLFAFCTAGALLVAWAGKRGVLLRVTSDELVYGGLFPKTISRSEVSEIQPMNDHIQVTLHDGRNIAVGRGFRGISLIGTRLVGWPQGGQVGPSPLMQLMNASD